MKLKNLLDELESLNHHQRIGRMVDLGKTSLTDKSIKSTLGQFKPYLQQKALAII